VLLFILSASPVSPVLLSILSKTSCIITSPSSEVAIKSSVSFSAVSELVRLAVNSASSFSSFSTSGLAVVEAVEPAGVVDGFIMPAVDVLLSSHLEMTVFSSSAVGCLKQ